MQTIDKIIDGKSVSFWLDGSLVQTSIFEAIASISANGSFFMREQNWFQFARAVLAPMPVPYDSDEAAELRNGLFGIVCDIATQLRKEAA
jgi:hypothetical protein